MKKLIGKIVAAAALLTGSAFAGEITAEQARTVAGNFVTKDSIGQSVLSGRTVDTVMKRGGFYLVTLKPAGHLLVGVNRSARPIPIFSETDFAEPEPGSPQVAFLAVAETNAINATGTKYEAQWRSLLGERVLKLTTSSANDTVDLVKALVTSTWDQYQPNTDFSPVVNGSAVYNGCVSTSYGQVMRYWQWPEIIDEDLESSNPVAKNPGFEQRIWAGTPIDWSAVPGSGFSNEKDRLNVALVSMLGGMLSNMEYSQSQGSAGENKRVTQNAWYTPLIGIDYNNNVEEIKEAFRSSFRQGCPMVISIMNPQHSLIADGYAENGDTFTVHLNFGWGGKDNAYYTLDQVLNAYKLSTVYPGQRPVPMVQMRPVNGQSAFPVSLSWAFPKKGYDALTGFTISYVEVGSATSTYTDDFTESKGRVHGNNVSVGQVNVGRSKNTVNFGNDANRAYYTLESKFIAEGAELLFDIRSENSRGMAVNVQAYNQSTGWETISKPTIADLSLLDWATVKVPLGKYAGRAVGIRFEVLRVSTQSASGGSCTGVQLDNVQITNVRETTGDAATVHVGADVRNYSFDANQLTAGKTYLFTVAPEVTDGIPAPSVSTEVVSGAPAVASIDAITSVRSSGYQVQQGFYRTGYLGLNQLAVYGSSVTTGLVVKLNHPTLISDNIPFWDTIDNKYIMGVGATSIVHTVSVEKKENGKFLVKLDLSCLTEYARTTRLLLTMEALDAKGNVARKYFNLFLNYKEDGESSITVEQLPDYGGSAPDPEPIYYTVTFNANNGVGGEQRQILSGNTISAFPTVSYAGHTLKGWFDQAEGGTRIYESQTITANKTYFAHWLTDTTPADPDEPVNPPSGGDDPVIDPTGGNANDFTDGGKTYRFCNGVNKTSGYKDVSRVGYYGYQAPGAYSLVLWWADAYKAVKGSYPTGYTAPNTNSYPNDGVKVVFPTLATEVFQSAVSTALPSAADRAAYFPTVAYTSAQWCGGTSGDAAVKAAGRRICTMLNNGPIGILVPTSSTRSYGGVIWGCEYAADSDGKYATVLYITSTKSNNDNLEYYTLVNVTVSGVGTMPGLKGFNSNGGVIQSYYPIVGPAGSGGGDDEPTTKTFIVTFDSDGGSAVNAQSVEDGKTLVSIPTPTKSGYTFGGWYDVNDNELTSATTITANITYTAHWTEIVVPPVDPDEPGEEPDDPTPDEPVIAGQKAGGNAVDTGTVSTTYGYRLVYNYWLARKLALQEKKKLFILSGASWCSYCTHTKEYLQGLGKDFTDKFVVYYVDRDNLANSPYFKGGLPQYGSADPRTVNPFAGIYGDGTSGAPDWIKAWYAADNGLYFGNRGGFSQEQVSLALSKANNSDPVADFERFEIRGPQSVMSGKTNTYRLYAIFADGSEMPVDHGVTWSLRSGAGTMTVSTSDGDASTKLAVASEQAVLRAESTYYFDGHVDLAIQSTEESKITGLKIVTKTLNLEDNRSPVLEATATLDDGTEVAISGVGTWTINSCTKKPRSDAELESNQAPVVSVDSFGRLTYNQGYVFDVYDHTMNVTLAANNISVSKDVTVWGPTRVAPDSWTLASKTKRLTRYGVVRLKCGKLKYNYGGEIKTTSDTYYGNFRTVMQFAGGSSEYSYLRGLAFMSSKTTAGNWTLGLQSQRVNGQYQYWTPENFANYHSESIVNVPEGKSVTDADHGLVTEGFFNAYWPTECAGKTTEQLQEFALLDSDGDGFANWQEYILGTDPTDKSDALYLTQGYQHLTAPANDLEAFQYKIMFAQRPGRYYYIYAKESWGEASWTKVAKINYSGMDANQGMQIEIINESKANNGKFFRVGAVLADHEFNSLSTVQVIPNLLVAAPGAIIDLTNETLPLNFSSFDTDATDAGTVWVRAAAGAKAGDVLMTAPKAAEKSLKACRPYERTDLAFEVVELGDTLALRVVGDAPAVVDGKGSVTVGDGKIIVAPNEGVAEITLVNVGEKLIEIPLSLSKVGGVTDSKKLIVKSGAYDVTEAMKFSPVDGGFGIELDEAAVVTVGAEKIPVRPSWANDDNEVPFEVSGGKIVFKVKSIPGLKYQVLVSDSLDPTGFAPIGNVNEATDTRREFTIKRTGENKGFFKVRVSR